MTKPEKFQKLTLIRIILSIIVLFSMNIHAEEYIQNFHSRINVLDDGDIHVTETITVNVENQQIRHGIYRNAPTIYFGVFFSHRNSDIHIISTKLDNRTVDYHTENLTNGIRIYLGSKDSYVSRGIHTYQIEYVSEQQVVDLEDNDGIYWNVTGNNWQFPIYSASADVYLPTDNDISIQKYEGWTGYQGSTEQNYTAKIFPTHIRFETTKRLNKHQGLTIQATWKKGSITNPKNKTWHFIKNNVLWMFSILSLLLYPIYYLKTWNEVGIDPPKGPIYPIFAPPDDISPAAMRFVWEKHHDTKGFSVAIMNLAVKKFITIEQLSKKEYLLTKSNSITDSTMSKGESKIYHYLFRSSNSIKIGKKYNSKVKTADNMLSLTVTGEFKNKCYKDNVKSWLFGVAIGAVVILLNWMHFFNFSSQALPFLIFPIVVTFASAAFVLLSNKTYQKVLAVIIPAIILGFASYSQRDNIFVAYLAIILFVVVCNGVFYYLIQAPTVFGRKLLDKIEGFKMYLQTAEQDRLEIMHPPEMTPELFEKYLPYALALGVENKWSEQFNTAMKVQGKEPTTYHPSWYIGDNFSHSNFSTTASSIGSGLASAAVAASTPPSSSGGGFSGGGFSGGGGGGGGGGGW